MRDKKLMAIVAIVFELVKIISFVPLNFVILIEEVLKRKIIEIELVNPKTTLLAYHIVDTFSSNLKF